MNRKSLLVIPLLMAEGLLAQTDRGVLTGFVMDSSDAGIPNATITLVSEANHLSRTAKSTAVGTYTIPALPVGLYTLTVTASGFETTTISSVELQVGKTRTLDVHLGSGDVRTEITVTAAPALEESSAVVGGVIEPEQIVNLPTNGRNWANLMALVPGAVDTGVGDQKSIRFAGRAQDDNNYRLDGVDATGGQNQAQRVTARLQIATDAIAEFRGSSALYGAESGGTTGGQLDVVTKSGSSSFHGSAFDFFRNDIFDARSFDNTGLRKPAFRMNQFGVSLGGPIVKDRTFFFLDFEAIRQHLGQTLTGLVPSPAFLAAARSTPAIAPILAAYPAGQQPTSDPNVYTYTGTGNQLYDESSGFVRVDHRFTSRTTGFVRFNLDRLVTNAPLGASNFFLNDRLATTLSPYNAIVSLQHIFTPVIVNDFKVGFNRSDFRTAKQTVLPYAISVPQFTLLSNSLQAIAVSNIFDFVDNATFVFGRHSVKAGAEVRRVQINQSATASPDLTITFGSAADLLKNVVSTVALNAPVPLTGLRKTEDFGYVQDQFKLAQNLTFTGGLRYEFYSNFHEAQGRGIVFDPKTCPPGGFCPAGSAFYFPYLLDLEPRLALSWLPFPEGKTVVTTGYGLYYGDGQLGDLNAPVNNLATRLLLNGKGLTYPVDGALAAGLSTSSSPRGLARNRVNQQVQAWDLSVQQALPARVVVQLTYLGTKGTHLFTRSFVNGRDPATGVQPIPTLGLVDYKSTDSNSVYHALEANIRHDFNKGLFFSANYQWAHSINDGATGGGEAVAAQNVNCRACDRASSDFDIRHYLSASLVYELPFGRGRRYFNGGNRMTNLLAGGWQLSAIGTARSGLPLNILVSRKPADLPDLNNSNQRPDLVVGVSQYPGVKTRQHWLNPAAYAVPKAGTWGNLGRNSVRAPGLWQVDPALSKRTAITERSTLEFRAEAFNVFNRSQIGLPAVNISSTGTFGLIPTFVNVTPTGTGTPRILQFMLRAQF